MSFLLALLLGMVVWYIIKAAIAVSRARKRASEFFDSINSEAREASRHTRKGGWSSPARRKSKKIDPSVGEYVDFEEITVSHTSAADTGSAPGEKSDRRQAGRKDTESQISDAEWEDI